MGCRPVSSRLIVIRLRASPFNITSYYDDDAIEDFYERLQEILDQSPKKDILVVLGDWNAKVGEDALKNWKGTCGRYCNRETNERGLRLLEFACYKRSCAGEYTWQTQSIQKMDMAQPKWRIP